MSTEATTLPVDHAALVRSREYRGLLVVAAMLGVLVSAASWAFLELVHVIQEAVYERLPNELGYDVIPWWWPLPVLAIAGAVTAFAVVRLPGTGGHVPYAGIKAGASDPIELPGILLAAFATLGLGLVLGPEGPLIAMATGLAVFAVRSAKKDTPDQAMTLLSASAAIAAIAAVFGSPIVGTIILIEAAGLGGPTLTLVLLPPFAQFGWSIVLAIGAAVVTLVIVELARASDGVVRRRPFALMPAVGVAVASIAIVFGQITDRNELAILFSGQEAFG